jgi:hypothetical protein
MGQNLLPVVTKNSVGIVAIEVLGQWNYVRAVMRELIFSLLYSLSCGLQTRARLHLEICRSSASACRPATKGPDTSQIEVRGSLALDRFVQALV